MHKRFQALTPREKKELLSDIIADDIPSALLSVIKTASPYVLNHVWSKVKDTSLVSKARKYLKDYLGVDLNDDRTAISMPDFNINSSL